LILSCGVSPDRVGPATRVLEWAVPIGEDESSREDEALLSGADREDDVDGSADKASRVGVSREHVMRKFFLAIEFRG
jgi:hypothetical protein